jgi:YD repeat-containing protein
VHRFYGLGYFTPAAVAASPALYNVCNPKRPLFDTYCGFSKTGAWQVGLPVDITVGGDYIERYVYQPRLLTSANEQVVAGRVRIADAQVLVPDLQSKSIVVHGVSFNTTYANYDQYGNARTITESGPRGGNRTTTVSYHNDPLKWILKQVKDESFPGSATSRSFDSNGNLLSVTKDGVKTSHTYDGEGNVASTTFPRNLVHSYSNYKRGIPQTERQPEGVEITRTVSDAGNVTTETNGEGHTRTYGFDGMNRMTSMTYARGNATAIAYRANAKDMTRGNLVESTAYDGFGRPQSITLGGITRSYGYDALGRKTFESNPGSMAGTTYQYDVLNRPARIINADGSSQTISYAGIDKTVIDERKNSTTYRYRAYGDIKHQFLMGVVTADPAMSISVERNARDLVTAITQGGLTRRYGYNGNYYLSSVTNPETDDTIYGRDEAGNMTSRQVGSSGKVIFAYDGRNRVTSATYRVDTPSVSYTYSKTDKISSVSSSVGSRVNKYDDNDNLISESVTVDGMNFSTDYAYNRNDQLESITYPRSRRVVSYMPDVLGRPTQVSGYVSSIAYWPSGQISQINYVNGTTSVYGQNARLWPSSFSTAKGGNTYIDNSYDYDGVGNLTSIRNSADSRYNRTLGYDAVNRLDKIDGPWGAGTILYDGVGNIKSQALGASLLNYSYDPANRLGSVFGDRSTQFTYDAYGNVIAAQGNSYAYDQVPNLRCINCSDPSLKTEYSYDGLNRRLVVNKAGEKSYEIFGSHGNLLIEFTPGQTNKLIEYFYLGGKRIAQTITR